MAKVKKSVMGEYITSELESRAYVWCIRNKIYIYPVALDKGVWTIEIKNKDKTSRDPNSYTKTDIWKTTFKYYKHYYNKYNEE